MFKRLPVLCMSALFLYSSACSSSNDLDLFKSPLAISLKWTVGESRVDQIKDPNLRKAAQLMLDDEYSTQYRYVEIEPMLSPVALGKKLVIGNGYSAYEGVTGVVLPEGEQTIIVDGLAQGETVDILVPNWLRMPPNENDPTKDPNGWGLHKKVYTLKNGVNSINIEKEGLAYVSYYFDKPEEHQPIKLHFVNGIENGYFDLAVNDDEDWMNLLNGAKYPIMDAVGERIQIAYPVKDLLKHASNRGVDLVARYDSLVMVQHEIMGLEKYDKVPDNKILARVNYNYYMFRDGDGVAYMGGPRGHAMHMVANPDVVISGDPCWGFSHEVGHVHQLRPYLNWGGLGEVSNNIFSLYATTYWKNKSRVSEQKNYDLARKSIIDGEISYLQDDDVFNRLIPFWQLQLYFSQYGNPDFYPDLFEAFRQQAAEAQKGGDDGWGARGGNPAEYQLNFVKKVCEVSGVDLVDFFDKWGFFYVGDFEINDYGKYKYHMTQKMVDDCLAEIAAMELEQPKIDLTTLRD